MREGPGGQATPTRVLFPPTQSTQELRIIRRTTGPGLCSGDTRRIKPEALTSSLPASRGSPTYTCPTYTTAQRADPPTLQRGAHALGVFLGDLSSSLSPAERQCHEGTDFCLFCSGRVTSTRNGAWQSAGPVLSTSAEQMDPRISKQ